MQVLEEGTGKSSATVYRMIEKTRAKLLLPNDSKGRNTAANFLASKYADITKFNLSKEELDEVRNLQRTGIPIQPTTQFIDMGRVKQNNIVIEVDGKLIEIFRLPKNLANEAKSMSQVYPQVYLLENLVRYVVMRVLNEKYGDNWWDKANISGDVRKEVQKRIFEEDVNRWHSKRGSNPIFYTNFDDLRSIIINNWEHFRELFPDQIWIQSRLKDIEPSRNIIAHNNPLGSREIQRIKLVVEDFRKQLIEKSPLLVD